MIRMKHLKTRFKRSKVTSERVCNVKTQTSLKSSKFLSESVIFAWISLWSNIFNLRWLDAAASFFFEQLGIIEFFVINVGVIYTSTAMPHTCKSPVIMMQVLSNSFLNSKFSNHTLAEIVVSIDIFKILTL